MTGVVVYLPARGAASWSPALGDLLGADRRHSPVKEVTALASLAHGPA